MLARVNMFILLAGKSSTAINDIYRFAIALIVCSTRNHIWTLSNQLKDALVSYITIHQALLTKLLRIDTSLSSIVLSLLLILPIWPIGYVVTQLISCSRSRSVSPHREPNPHLLSYLVKRYNQLVSDVGVPIKPEDYSLFHHLGITTESPETFNRTLQSHRIAYRGNQIGSATFHPNQLRSLYTSARQLGDRTTYPRPEKGSKGQPKSLWTSYIISHILESTFRTELESIIRGLKPNTFHAIYVTLFGQGHYYSLGSQFIINNEAVLDKVIKELTYQYELLQNRYDLSPTEKSLVKVRELKGYSSKINEFFFRKMETDPFKEPHKVSDSIIGEINYPYIDLSAATLPSISNLQIITESRDSVKFIWSSVQQGKETYYYVEYDKTRRQGTSSNSDRQIPFEDTMLSNKSIKRSSLGFEIIFNPETRKVLNYYYHTRVEEELETKSVENPNAEPK